MIKTRKVSVIGKLIVRNASYLLVRQEKIDGFPVGVYGFTVLSNSERYQFLDDEKTTGMYHDAPIFITTTSAWTIEYCKPYDVDAVDDTDETDVIQEVDYSQIPEPEMTEQEWEYRLSQIDKENVT